MSRRDHNNHEGEEEEEEEGERGCSSPDAHTRTTHTHTEQIDHQQENKHWKGTLLLLTARCSSYVGLSSIVLFIT